MEFLGEDEQPYPQLRSVQIDDPEGVYQEILSFMTTLYQEAGLVHADLSEFNILYGPLLEFTAFLSLNLAIINLLPLPALDGGRIFFVFIEWIRGGRRISPKVENLIHMIGFFLLIGLMLTVTFQDIIRIAGN
ncbi:peptidase [Dehalococcoides mccartyi]|uniref:non-specific serine/threonine protein kinase n=1 Tax=Dehalococcoides mccartyi TaxID=61435 RepID=A0A2J1DVP6_9CHLR|nr:peptidase [Dehalococcoides mccartyi]